MATSYPGGLDAFTNPTATDSLNSATVPHATQHANANDAIEAIQAELGTDPAGASATVKARFDAIEAAGWVTSTRILDGTIVDGDINAAAAIAQSKVANLTTDLAAKAPAASPTFTGTVTTPLTTAGYVKTDSGGVLSSSAAIAQADVTNLTSDLAGKLAIPGAWSTWTVVLKSNSTDVTMGSGSVSQGYYIQVGRIVHFNVVFVFGTGLSVPAGDLRFNLPVTAARAAQAERCATGNAYDASAIAATLIGGYLFNTTTCQLDYSRAGGYGSVSGSLPYTWAASDALRVFGTYEAAS